MRNFGRSAVLLLLWVDAGFVFAGQPAGGNVVPEASASEVTVTGAGIAN